MATGIEYDHSALERVCQRWEIVEVAIFGSAARGEMRPDSDLDVLITFAPGARWTLFDLVDLKADIEAVFKRPVDLVEKGAIRNPFRLRAILESAEVLHAA